MRLRIMALTIALGLGLAGSAAADDSGSWWPRWMSPWSGQGGKGEAIDPAKMPPGKEESAKPPSLSDAGRKKRAKADLERRQEVLIKLREIAAAANDEEMLKTVEQLEHRAWDLYVAATNMRADPVRASAEPSMKKEGR
jgi:hypothetical protein